jgi:protein involved in polysaccharide export with SLBB domain
MKICFIILITALVLSGCSSPSKAQLKAQNAALAAENAALRRQQAQSSGVTIIGPVQNPAVPWVAGLTLAQAIATANYLNPNEPTAIVITRQGERAVLDPKVLLNGKDIPLEIGDVIELR